jgi:hypothetical protein
MDGFLRQSTAVTIKIGPFIDDTDGKSPEDGLTISQSDVRVSKNGGDMASKSSAASCTHDEIGYYNCALDTTDTGTLGILEVAVHESGSLPVWHRFMVMPANVWDSMFGADRLQVHTAEITSGLITSSVLAAGAITAATIATDAIDGDAIASSAVTEIQSGLATASSISTLAGYVDTEVAAILAAVDTEVAAIKAKTDLIPASPASTGDIPTAGAVADAVWDEAISGHLGAGSAGNALNTAGSAGDPWTTPLPGAYGAGTAGNILGNRLDVAVGTRLATAGYTAPLDAAGVRGAVGLASANLDTQLTNIDNFIDTEVAAILAAVDTEVAAIKAKTDNLPAAPAAVGSAMTLAAGAITAAVIATDAIDGDAIAATAVTEIQSGLATAASITTLTGYVDTEVAAIKAKTDNLPASPAATGDIPTAATIADAVWDEAIAGHVAAGSFGSEAQSHATTSDLSTLATAAALATVDSNVDTILAAVDTEIAAIKAKTDNLPASPAATGDIPTAATVADAVWDEVLSGHLTAGSTGSALNAAGSAGDPWATTLPGAYGAGTAGKIIGDNLDAQVSTRLATAGYTAPLGAAGVRGAVGLASANLDTQLSGLSTLDSTDVQTAAEAALTAYDAATPADLSTLATAAAVATVDSNVDSILTAVDTEVAAIKGVTDKLDTALELDGAEYRLTANALEQAPSAGGGTADWTEGEKEQIRHRLGLDGASDEPTAAPSLSTAIDLAAALDDLAAIKAKTDNIPDDPASDTTPVSLSAGAISDVTEAVDNVIVAHRLNELLSGSVSGPLEETSLFGMLTEHSSGGDIQFTPIALEDSARDWTAVEKEQIRYRLGLDGDMTTPVATADLPAQVWKESLAGPFSAGPAGDTVNDIMSTVGAIGSPTGVGAVETIYTVKDNDGDPIPDVDVWVSANSDGGTVVARGRTNASGEVTFWLDSGTYYAWRQKNGWNFTNPTTFTVSE